MAERVSDERLALVAADPTGFDTNVLSIDELIGLVRELVAWRKYKLSDEEKRALGAVWEQFAETGDSHGVAWGAIDRLTKGARNG